MIARLGEEEDALALLVSQYEENGDKLLVGLMQNRDLQKAQIERELAQRRQGLSNIYEEVKNFVDQSRETAEKSDVTLFEKQWRKNQDDILRKINQGRRMTDG